MMIPVGKMSDVRLSDILAFFETSWSRNGSKNEVVIYNCGN